MSSYIICPEKYSTFCRLDSTNTPPLPPQCSYTSFEKDVPVPSIEVNRVGRGEPMHPAAEVGLMTLGDQMVVIAHQNIPVQRDVVALERFNKQLHELRAIRFVGENPLPGIAPAS
jgi:hypothetical protein